MTSNDADYPKRWDIWLALVRFEDSPELKQRPIVVISPEAAYIISLKITTHAPRRNIPGEYPVRFWQEAGLNYQSTIRVSKILELVPDDFVHRIGRLHPLDILQVQKLWRELHRT